MSVPLKPNHEKIIWENPGIRRLIEPVGLCLIFFTFNILSALFAPILDCDETFNYWEPTHYISHGYGLQTWEYSPEYAIRSWLYVTLHALIGSFRRLFPLASKVAEFYFIRYVLAFTCSMCQTVMFLVIKKINFRVALIFMISMVFSPGIYHASVSFLPSSFSMYTTMLGMSAFMNKRKKERIIQGMLWFSVGGIIGWPFSLVLSVPFLLEEIIVAYKTSRDALKQTARWFKHGIFASLLVLFFEILVSGIFYRRLAVVPLNIVLYNVLSGPGPNLYGTEAWHFYFRNLLLNFNFWFILAFISLPLYILQGLPSRNKQSIANGVQGITLLSPFYLWLVIFSFQPHKEERFLYPAYPCLTLNAAISLHILLTTFGNIHPSRFLGKIPGWIKLLTVLIFLLVSIGVGLARIYGIHTAYSGSLYIYEPLSSEDLNGNVVCFGKEWYRFPSSYHLPKKMRAKFIRSEFRGLLPGNFLEVEAKYGLRNGTWLIPPGMNNQNQEDLGKYTEISSCDFLVDTHYPENTPSSLEPQYVLDGSNWETLRCVPFLDGSRTKLLPRVLWVPELRLFASLHWQQVWSRKVKRNWGRHCLLKRKRENEKENSADEIDS